MNRFVRTALMVGAIAVAAGATEASAQISIGAGPSFAMGDLGDGLDMGYHAQVSLGFGLPMLPIGLQADVGLNRFAVSDIDDANFQTIHGAVNAVINLPTPGITPYLIGGVGYYNLKFDIAGEDADTNDFGINVGGGVRLGLPGLGVFAEARLHNVFTEGESSRFLPVTLGIRL